MELQESLKRNKEIAFLNKLVWVFLRYIQLFFDNRDYFPYQ